MAESICTSSSTSEVDEAEDYLHANLSEGDLSGRSLQSVGSALSNVVYGDDDSSSDEKRINELPRAVPEVITKDSFEFGQVLGEGAFGQVRLCVHKSTGRQFAAKILKKEQLIKAGQTKYVKSEKEILLSMDHPNISKLYYAFADPKRLYFIMELISGGELFNRLLANTNGQVPMDVARFYLAELVNAIGYIHNKDIVHRDVKPENLLLSSDGHLKLVDFGIAKVIDEAVGLHTFCGTVEYLAPEVVQNTVYGKGVDWWAFGCIVYELFAGNSPFFSSSTAITCQKILSRDIYWPPDFPKVVRDLCEKLLTVDEERRLGCGKGGVERVKAHPFFKGFDFDGLHKATPPIILKPSTKSDAVLQTGIMENSDAPKPVDSAVVDGNAEEPESEQRKINARFSLSLLDSDTIRRSKDVYRRSELLREMYPDLRRLPPRPPPLGKSYGASAQLESNPPIVQSMEPINVESVLSSPITSPPSSPPHTRSNSVNSTSSSLSASTNSQHELTLLDSLSGLKTPARCITWDSKGRQIAISGNFSMNTYKFTKKKGADEVVKLEHQLSADTGSSASYLNFSPDGEIIAFDMQRHIGMISSSSSSKSKKPIQRRLAGHSLPVTNISFNPEGDRMASGGSDKQIFIWNVHKTKIVHKFEAHMSYISAMNWSPKLSGGNVIVSGGGDSRILFYDPLVGRVIQKVDYHRNSILGVEWCPTAKVVASCSLDRNLVFLDTNSWKLIKVLAHPTPVLRVEWSPNGQYLATATKNSIRVWSFPEMKQVSCFHIDDAPLHAGPLSWDHTSTQLAFTNDTFKPVVLDISSNTFARVTGNEHTKPITTLMWSPKQQILATGSLDKTVNFWSFDKT